MTVEKHITPALFVSHGSPMNAIATNAYTNDLRKIGEQLKEVKTILVISAHWETSGLFITAAENLSTYHDFRGFPNELFAVEYPVKGAIDLIPVIENLINEPLQRDSKRGLDHGAWSMLVHLFPEANIPVLQLSLDRNKTFQQHYELAKKLAPLREQNVLILASGNITHNFSHLDFNNVDAEPLDWAFKFDETIKETFTKNKKNTLINIKNVSDVYNINHPTDDHYIPLLYLMGVRNEKDKVLFPHMSWQNATMSMRHILLNSSDYKIKEFR
ncbi:MAG: 4,5-DOPA dioxygenase extradiol [Bacteroidota bacterium]